MIRIKIWLSAGLFALIGLQSTGSLAAHLGCPDPSGFPISSGCNVPGSDVPGSGFPYFETGVEVDYKAKKNGEITGDFKLKAKYDNAQALSRLVFNEFDFFNIENTTFKTKKKIKVKKGVVKKGKIIIKGTIDELGITKKTELVKFDLKGGDWVVSDDGQLLGFDIFNIECNPDLPIFCTKTESLWLSLSQSVNDEKNLKKVPGVAVATVPLPAAAWLFGSGLLCLVGMARKHRPIMN